MQWKVLVVDETSKKLIYNAVSEDDILNLNVTSMSPSVWTTEGLHWLNCRVKMSSRSNIGGRPTRGWTRSTSCRRKRISWIA